MKQNKATTTFHALICALLLSLRYSNDFPAQISTREHVERNKNVSKCSDSWPTYDQTANCQNEMGKSEKESARADSSLSLAALDADKKKLMWMNRKIDGFEHHASADHQLTIMPCGDAEDYLKLKAMSQNPRSNDSTSEMFSNRPNQLNLSYESHLEMLKYKREIIDRLNQIRIHMRAVNMIMLVQEKRLGQAGNSYYYMKIVKKMDIPNEYVSLDSRRTLNYEWSEASRSTTITRCDHMEFTYYDHVTQLLIRKKISKKKYNWVIMRNKGSYVSSSNGSNNRSTEMIRSAAVPVNVNINISEIHRHKNKSELLEYQNQNQNQNQNRKEEKSQQSQSFSSSNISWLFNNSINDNNNKSIGNQQALNSFRASEENLNKSFNRNESQQHPEQQPLQQPLQQSLQHPQQKTLQEPLQKPIASEGTNSLNELKFLYNFDTDRLEELNALFKKYIPNDYIINYAIIQDKISKEFYLNARTKLGKHYLNKLSLLANSEKRFAFKFNKSNAVTARTKSTEFWNIIRYEAYAPQLKCAQPPLSHFDPDNHTQKPSDFIGCNSFNEELFFREINRRGTLL
jgi:hypothetical protein